MNLPAPPYGEFKSILNEFNNSQENFYQNLDKELRIWLDSKEIFHFSNCFTAISIALRSSIKNNSSYVAVAALGYRRTLDIIKWSGLQPYILDNDLDSLALSLKELRQCMTSEDTPLHLPYMHNASIYMHTRACYCPVPCSLRAAHALTRERVAAAPL